MELDVIRTGATEEFTGRYLVLLREDSGNEGAQALINSVGAKINRVASGEDAMVALDAMNDQDAVILENFGIAVVNADSAALSALSTAADDSSNPIELIAPERVAYAIGSLEDYLKGYRDGTNQLIDKLQETEHPNLDDAAIQVFIEMQNTWGLQATRVVPSRFTGQGIKVAVLDTGLDLNHVDFRGRNITSRSFVPGQTVQDGNGHGTHCIGTSCGPRNPNPLPRFGIAYAADIFVGKVLNNQGSGQQSWILAGIDWAIQNGCHVISMSLGSFAPVGAQPDPFYERVGQIALQRGSLIIAASGNESARPGIISPVGYPANSPSIMAVAALNDSLQVAPFSNGGLNANGGGVDISGPGVNVYSSVPGGHARFNGTSMATPHVAGIAALHAQASGARGAALWAQLTQSARRLNLPSRDVGIGLVQAP